MNIKLNKVIRSKNNYPLGMILYASIIKCGIDIEISNDSNSYWVCTCVDNPY